MRVARNPRPPQKPSLTKRRAKTRSSNGDDAFAIDAVFDVVMSLPAKPAASDLVSLEFQPGVRLAGETHG